MFEIFSWGKFLHKGMFPYLLAEKCCRGKLCANCFKFSRQKSLYVFEQNFLDLTEIHLTN